MKYDYNKKEKKRIQIGRHCKKSLFVISTENKFKKRFDKCKAVRYNKYCIQFCFQKETVVCFHTIKNTTIYSIQYFHIANNISLK